MIYMHAEQFIYGLLNGDELELRATPNLHKLVTNEELLMLCHIGDKETEEAGIEYFTSKWLSISYITPMTDKSYRRANWNHTFIIKLADYLAFTQPKRLVQNHVIKCASELPEKLKVLKLG